MLSRRTFVFAGIGLVAALLAAPIILLILAGPAEPAVATPSRSPVPARTSFPSASLQPDDVAWWRLDADVVGRFPVVRVGTLANGETASFDLRTRPIPAGAGQVARPSPRVLGPVDGDVILVEEDGAESLLTAVNAPTGVRRELIRTTELIIDAAVAGDDLVFLTTNELDGTPTGLWRISITKGGDPEEIRGLVGVRPDFTTVAVVDWITELVASSDGGTLAIHRCVRLECELRGLDVTTGETWRIPVEFGSGPVGIVGGFILFEPACVDVDCRLQLLDIETGAVLPAPGSPDRQLFESAVIDAPRPTVITVLSGAVVGPGAGPVQLELLDLESMTFAPLPIDLGSLALLGRFDHGAGIELAPGTILVTGGEWGAERMGYYVIDLRTGETTPVPVLGEVFVQG
jgi:hypothetical protein